MAEKTKDNIDFRKKRVKRIKKVIILPVVLSIVLFFRVKKLENRIETIVSENELESGGEEVSTEIVNAKEKEIVTGSAVEEEKTKRVYLTFDDGPSKQTERVLNILKKKKVKATFFAIGREKDIPLVCIHILIYLKRYTALWMDLKRTFIESPIIWRRLRGLGLSFTGSQEEAATL